MGPDERLVTLVLCGADGQLLGSLPPFGAAPRWWPDTDRVVRLASERHGIDVTVLRLLTTSGGHAGGGVSYLAEVVAGKPTRLLPVASELAAAVESDPAHRLWWAEPGWWAEVGEWVDEALASLGRRRTGPLCQRKTWNLSLVVTAPTDRGVVWLKAIPPFLADEGGIITRVARVDSDLVPRILGHDPARRAILMETIDGADQHGLGSEPGDDKVDKVDKVIDAMVSRWVQAQADLAGDLEHCVALGAGDLRAGPLLRDVADLIRHPEIFATLTMHEHSALGALVDALPRRLEAIAQCGLPDTLVHGDLHPGNWRRDGNRLTLLDWGDVGVGNPVIDIRAFVERLADEDQRRRTTRVWARCWHQHVPGADPLRAAELLRPVAQLAAAAAYQRFLDHIEATERIYHAADPAERLRAALAAVEEPR